MGKNSKKNRKRRELLAAQQKEGEIVVDQDGSTNVSKGESEIYTGVKTEDVRNKDTNNSTEVNKRWILKSKVSNLRYDVESSKIIGAETVLFDTDDKTNEGNVGLSRELNPSGVEIAFDAPDSHIELSADEVKRRIELRKGYQRESVQRKSQEGGEILRTVRVQAERELL